MIRKSYHMPEQEWDQVVADYLSPLSLDTVARMHLSSPASIRNLLVVRGVQLRSRSEARQVYLDKNPRSSSGPLPTEEEILERAREIRELGYWGGNGKTNHRRWHPPWTPAEEEEEEEEEENWQG